MALGKASMQIAEEILGYLDVLSGMPQNSEAVEYTREHFYHSAGKIFPPEDVREAEQHLKEKGYIIFNEKNPDSMLAKARLSRDIQIVFLGIAAKDDGHRYIKNLVEGI